MSSDSARVRRIADRIREIVAATLERQIKDPRLGFVTVTDVRLTADLHDATVFYTVLGDELARTESAAALESAKGIVRSTVGRQVGLRFTPTISFVHDALPESAHHIEELIAAAHQHDEEIARAAAHAMPAGDADPYRHPDADDDEAVL